MNSVKKVGAGVAQGLGGLAKKTIFESAKQTGKVAEELAEGIVGGQPNPPASPQGKKPTIISQPEQTEAEEREKERLRKSISGRDLEGEIKAVRRKKGQEEKKKKEEEELLKKISEERKKEVEAAQIDALAATGSRPQKGSAFTGPKGSGEKIRKKN